MGDVYFVKEFGPIISFRIGLTCIKDKRISMGGISKICVFFLSRNLFLSVTSVLGIWHAGRDINMILNLIQYYNIL